MCAAVVATGPPHQAACLCTHCFNTSNLGSAVRRCRYQTPAEREEAFAASLRAQKQAAASQAAALVKQYGPEGAAAMQQILAMKKPNRRYIHIKTSREDVQEVQQLPTTGLPDP